MQQHVRNLFWPKDPMFGKFISKYRIDAKLGEGGMCFVYEAWDTVLERPVALKMMQEKLLRWLQACKYKPLGSKTVRRADARVLAATHRDLCGRIAEGLFREDLFYRLNVIELKLPPLREREEDVVLMAEYFLARWGRQANAPAKRLSEEIQAEDLPMTLLPHNACRSGDEPSNFMRAKQSVIEKFERAFIATSLQATRGNISEAARRAGMYKKISERR